MSMQGKTTSNPLDGKTLRFHFNDGPMKGKDFDHTFRGDKVDWGAAGTDKTDHERWQAGKAGRRLLHRFVHGAEWLHADGRNESQVRQAGRVCFRWQGMVRAQWHG